MDIDIDKLLTLRAKHSDLCDRYLSVVEKARTARRDAVHMQAELPADPAGEATRDIAAMPASELAKLSVDTLEKADINLHHVRRVIAAHALADRMRRDADELAQRVRASQALIDRVNYYASKQPEAML